MILESYGFVEVGNWQPGRDKSKIEARLSRFANERAVYAFVVDNEVKYIGICDNPKTTLKKRMGSQRYNKCMPDLIRKALEADKVVKIFALVPEDFEYRGLKVDFVRGLEYPLIDKLNNPPWNDELKKWRRRKRQDKKG